MKKQYIQPSMKVQEIKVTNMICGSGNGVSTIPQGGSGSAPQKTTQGGNTGIFGESKSSNWFDEI